MTPYATRRNPVDKERLVLNATLVFGGFYLLGAMQVLPPPLQDSWQRWFARGQPRSPSFWDRLGKEMEKQPPRAAPIGRPGRPGHPGRPSAPPSPPPSQAPPPQAYIEFWSDRYSYPVGEPVEFHGRVFLDGRPASGRLVTLVDPDAGGGRGMPWMQTVTNGDGWWFLTYTGQDTAPWRTYAVDEASGARTGPLTFQPVQPVSYSPGSGSVPV